MNIKCYKGFTRTADPIYSNDIIQYTVAEGRLHVMLKGYYPTLGMKYNDIVNVEISNGEEETLTFVGRFLSMNYVVYDDPKKNDSPIVADNSILFELLEV